MITAGIDVGAENTKSVISENDRLLSYSIILQGREAVISVAERALSEALKKAGIKYADIECVMTTGVGSGYINFSNGHITEPSACARGASWLLPSTGTVIDMGAEKTLVVRCQCGKPISSVRNDRCASGTGRFLEIVARQLAVNVEEMGELSLQSHQDLEIESTCAVFAESEVISLVHLRHRSEDIARAIFKGLTRRIYSMLMMVDFKENLTLIGGLAKNVGMVKEIEMQTGCHILVPEEHMIVGALGAALIAAGKIESN